MKTIIVNKTGYVKNLNILYHRNGSDMGRVVIPDPEFITTKIEQTKVPKILWPLFALFGWKKPDAITVDCISIDFSKLP